MTPALGSDRPAGWLSCLSRDAQRLRGGCGPSKALLLGLVNPRFYPVVLYRLARLFRRPGILRPVGLVLTVVNWLVFRVEIALDTPIGAGLFLPHGNVILGACSIGEDFSAFSGVVVGSRSGNLGDPMAPVGADRPVIGSRVTLFSNAVVAGPVTVGDGARVAACTLVTDPVPPGAVVRAGLLPEGPVSSPGVSS